MQDIEGFIKQFGKTALMYGSSFLQFVFVVAFLYQNTSITSPINQTHPLSWYCILLQSKSNQLMLF